MVASTIMHSLLLLMLVSTLVFAGSSPALAYPLNDGSAIWGFEGHGSDGIGGPEHSVVGELHIFPTGTALTATLDGTSLLAGDSHAQVLDSAPGIRPR